MKLKYVERDLTLTFQEIKGLRRTLDNIAQGYIDKDHKVPAYIESIIKKIEALS